MGCGIYQITNTFNDKKYIGSSIEMDVRLMKHKYMLRNGNHYNNYLQNSYNKYGEHLFTFKKIIECEVDELIKLENYYINLFESNNLSVGYNLATVNEFRRNNFNEEVKVKNSKLNLQLYGNFTKFSCVNIITSEVVEFDDLVNAAKYIKDNNFSKGKLSHIRQKISCTLRSVKVHNGVNNNGSVRKTAYKHKWIITQ